jgi:heme/copper-type cytochrome/quinol oxidase subunit 4
MRSETVFKSGMALAYIAEIIFLCVFMYMAFIEYNGTSVETIGFNMVIICGVVGSGAMLWGLYEILKWKSL